MRGVIDNAGEILAKQSNDKNSQLSLNSAAIYDVTSTLALQLQQLNNTDPNSSAVLGSILAAFTIYKNSTEVALATLLVSIVSLIIAFLNLISCHCLRT